MEKNNKSSSNQKSDVRRFSGTELLMRRSTLPLHSFLSANELSLYYILDRFPVHSQTGLADRNIVTMLSRIMAVSYDETEQTIWNLYRLGFIDKPGTDTSWLETALNFPVITDFCSKLGAHSPGFGLCLRNVIQLKNVDEITPAEFGMAEKALRALDNLTPDTPSIDMNNKNVKEHFTNYKQ